MIRDIHHISISYYPTSGKVHEGEDIVNITVWEKPGCFGRTTKITPECLNDSFGVDLVAVINKIFEGHD